MSRVQVIAVKVGKEPELLEIENSVEGLQDAIGGGYFQMLTNPLGLGLDLFFDEEGHLKRLPLNRDLGFALIVGDFIFARHDGPELVSVRDGDLEAVAARLAVSP